VYEHIHVVHRTLRDRSKGCTANWLSMCIPNLKIKIPVSRAIATYKRFHFFVCFQLAMSPAIPRNTAGSVPVLWSSHDLCCFTRNRPKRVCDGEHWYGRLHALAILPRFLSYRVIYDFLEFTNCIEVTRESEKNMTLLG